MLRKGEFMAIYHLSVQAISRDQGKSCVAAAAYRSGQKLYNERQNLNYDYTKRHDIESEIIAPDNSPKWVYDRAELWNTVDKKETRCNSRTAREINVALPIELSKENQKELAREYIKNNFVKNGMIADLCFHFNDINNPHFHVMLTTREINENGFTNKNRDWDKKEKVKEWRKGWEVITNNVLKSNEINTEITCESYKNLGNEKIPTIHEGYVAREMQKDGKESEKINRNKLIRERNKVVVDLRQYKEIKQENENDKNLYRNFSPDEKRILANAAKELKMYINYDNVNNRLVQLKRWQKSLSFKEESIDKTNKLKRINKEEDILLATTNILEIEADRFIQKNYRNLDIDKINIDEKIEIINITIQNRKMLNPDEIQLIIDNLSEVNLKKFLNDIFKNNTRFTMSVQKDIKHIEKILGEFVEKYNIDYSKPETAKNASIKVFNSMKMLHNRKEDLIKALKIMNNIYDIELKKMYPKWEGRLNLKIEEKELFIMSKEYFGKTIRTNDFKNITYKYNSMQQEEILNILDIENNDLLKEKYPDFKINDVYKNMFYMECHSNDNLNIASKKLIRNYFDKDNFMKNFKVFENKYTNSMGNNKRFRMSIQEDIEHIKKELLELVENYDIDYSKPETAKNAPVEVFDRMKALHNRKEDLIKILNIMNSNSIKVKTRFIKSVPKEIEHIDKVLNEFVKKYNIDYSKPETAKNASVEVFNKMKALHDRKNDLTNAFNSINSENINTIENNEKKHYASLNNKRSLLFEFIGGLIDEIDKRVQENSIENDIRKKKLQRHRTQSQDFDL